MKNPIFISYKRVDKDRVFEIKNFIESETGLSCWIDLVGIESDAQFEDVIIDAIDSCELFIYCYSKEHLNIVNYEDDWTIKELDFAQEERKRIVFINLDKTPLTKKFKFRYRQKQQVDALDHSRLIKLVSDIKKWFDISDESKKKLRTVVSHTSSDSEEDLYQQGYRCYNGTDGVVRNVPLAFKYFMQAAVKNHRKAQKQVAKFYSLGIGGVTHDESKAKYWEALSKLPTDPSTITKEPPKSLVFDFMEKKVYFILSEDKQYYLGNLKAEENDVSWWDNKWIQGGGAAAILTAAVALSAVTVPIAILLLFKSIGAILSDKSENSSIVTTANCKELSKQIGYTVDLPTEEELKGVKDQARKSCVVLRLRDNPSLISGDK